MAYIVWEYKEVLEHPKLHAQNLIEGKVGLLAKLFAMKQRQIKDSIIQKQKVEYEPLYCE